MHAYIHACNSQNSPKHIPNICKGELRQLPEGVSQAVVLGITRDHQGCLGIQVSLTAAISAPDWLPVCNNPLHDGLAVCSKPGFG